jgi:flagellar biogenesis protein FliO
MAHEPHTHEPAHEPAEPDRGGLAGYAAIKYTAIVIVVLAIIAFLIWLVGRFT